MEGSRHPAQCSSSRAGCDSSRANLFRMPPENHPGVAKKWQEAHEGRPGGSFEEASGWRNAACKPYFSCR
ncbi:hypothetical protein GBAR_LOCUS24845 [Geodia barretti]|uniref:Uncharacterized protein n=1 Tax=Geodia barretti TaxID=519541 RepID=A0AA35TAQ6_GEOBA|nr:hypothetical protein GBAR_LOCUS24845 [Geodia barretti]